MNELVKLAIEANGGLERWKQYSTLSSRLVQGGALWGLKGKAGVLDDATSDERRSSGKRRLRRQSKA